jgi:two-component system, OmpR family, sensor histidine kinase CreC
MTSPSHRQKWRPSLSFIIFASLVLVMTLPLAGLFIFRLYDNQLIRQTEAELIAQGAALSAIYAEKIEQRIPDDIKLGAVVADKDLPAPDDDFVPIRPKLDLAGEDLQIMRPDAHQPTEPADPSYQDIGLQLQPLLRSTQRITLAGLRVLDFNGTVIAGRDEIGLSLAHLPEVATALRGRYGGALRIRIPDKPPPPIYSINRGTGLRVFVAIPVIVQKQVAGAIYLSRTPSNMMEHLYNERGKFILAGLAVLCVTLLIGLVFARTIVRPMHDLISRIADIRRGDPEAFRPLAHYGTRDFALLSRNFLGLAEQLAVRTDHMSTFTAHLTHELKSPLTSIKGAAELLQDSIQSEPASLTVVEQQRFLANIIADTDRLAVIMHRLRDLARAETAPAVASCSLAGVIGDLQRRFPQLACDAEGDIDAPIPMSAENLLIVLAHLGDNAARHDATRFAITIVAASSDLRLLVSNDGDGISDQNRSRIFDAFFTTRREQGGTGMGLAIVQSMLRAHGASVHLIEAADAVTFDIRFANDRLAI